MRILLVNQTARPHTGGINRMVVESAEYFQSAGHAVAIAYWDGDQNAAGCPSYALPNSGEPAVMRAAMREVREQFQPDIVQLHSADNPYLIGEVAADMPSCRFIHDQSWFCSAGDRMAADFTPCHRPHAVQCLVLHYSQGCGGKDPRGNWQRWQLVNLKRNLNQAFPMRFQVASQFMRQGLVENGVPEENIDVTPLFARPPRASAQTEEGLLLVCARLVASKGVDILLEAMAMLPPNSCRLVVAGDGPERESLQTLSVRLALHERVRFLGEVSPEVLDGWYERASIVVNPTLRPEPFGLVGPEAMAHGKPVVAFPGGATEEWLQHGKTGLIAPERSGRSLADALSRLLQNTEERKAMGKASREAWNVFRPERYIERAVESFERAIAQFEAVPQSYRVVGQTT